MSLASNCQHCCTDSNPFYSWYAHATNDWQMDSSADEYSFRKRRRTSPEYVQMHKGTPYKNTIGLRNYRLVEVEGIGIFQSLGRQGDEAWNHGDAYFSLDPSRAANQLELRIPGCLLPLYTLVPDLHRKPFLGRLV